jgi:hypothetical protein
MSVSHPDTPLSIRATIIALHKLCDLNWNQIAEKLAVHPKTARSFFQRTEKLAGSSDFWELLS